MNETTVKERLIAYLNYKHIGQVKFAETVGLSRGYVNNIVNSIPQKTLLKITKLYTDLNPAWLLTGEGDMLKTSTTQINQTNNGTMAVGINNGTAHIPQASPPNLDELYQMCIEMTVEAKETHRMAVDILKMASETMQTAYRVNEAVRNDRENVQELFHTLKDARQQNVDENREWLSLQKKAFNTWLDEERSALKQLHSKVLDLLIKQTEETKSCIQSSTQEALGANNEYIISHCKSVDLSPLEDKIELLLKRNGLPRGAKTTSGEA